MERINQYEFFELGETLQPLKSLAEVTKIDAGKWLFPIWGAHTAIERLVKGQPLELTVSKACAVRLRNALWEFLSTHFRERDAEGNESWRVPFSEIPAIDGWAWHQAKQSLIDFETVFREEMREAAIYRVPPRGIWDTAKLIDAADQSFPAEIAMVIPDKTRDDWKAAGRCLAFNLLSASGFHVARAVEGTIEAYYQAAYGQVATGKKATLHSWGDYIKALEAARTASPAKASLVPTEKVVAEVRQMKDDYRNPIAHPRIVLSESDARMLFANGESLIIAMAQELKAAMPTPQNALLGLAPFTPSLIQTAAGTP